MLLVRGIENCPDIGSHFPLHTLPRHILAGILLQMKLTALPRNAAEFHSVQGDFLILQIDAIGEDFFTGVPVILKTEIMVAGNEDLVGVG